MSNVEFTDMSFSVKNLIHETAVTFLHEAGELLLTQVVRNQDAYTDTGQTKGSWESPVVDEDKLSCTVGTNYENAIWEEYGTGAFAEKGDGRKGWWVYVEGSPKSSGKGKSYSTLKEAKKAMAILRKKGLPAHVTCGKKPRRHFRNAYATCRPKIEKQAEKLFGTIR